MPDPYPAFCVCDTETGGLDERLNPLLTVNMLVVTDDLQTVLDDFQMRVAPPEGTVMEIMADPNDQSWNPKISHLVDAQGNEFPVGYKDEAPWVITAGAARVNGFAWEDWVDPNTGAIRGVPLETADATYCQFIKQWFTRHQPIGVCHNVPFDRNYIRKHLPQAFSCFLKDDAVDNSKGRLEGWYCTLKAVQGYKKRNKMKGSNKLIDAARMVNEDQQSKYAGTLTGFMDKAHNALADCYMCLGLFRWLVEHDA